MDFQTMINNQMQASRAEEMKNSEQFTLGELIMSLEGVSNKDLPVYFDEEKYKPTGLVSWRGSYCELAIEFENGGHECYEQPKDTCTKDSFGDHDYKCKCGGLKEHDTTLPEDVKVSDLLKVLNLAKGKMFIGYKGGDFTMGKTTPLWVANGGDSSGFKKEKGEDWNGTQAVIGITEKVDKVIIETQLLDY